MLNALCVVCINCHCIINSASRRTNRTVLQKLAMPKMKKRQWHQRKRKDSTAFVYNLITTNCLFICIYIYIYIVCTYIYTSEGHRKKKSQTKNDCGAEKRGKDGKPVLKIFAFVFFFLCVRWCLFHLSVVSNLCSSIYQSISYEFLISGFSCVSRHQFDFLHGEFFFFSLEKDKSLKRMKKKTHWCWGYWIKYHFVHAPFSRGKRRGTRHRTKRTNWWWWVSVSFSSRDSLGIGNILCDRYVECKK